MQQTLFLSLLHYPLKIPFIFTCHLRKSWDWSGGLTQTFILEGPELFLNTASQVRTALWVHSVTVRQGIAQRITRFCMCSSLLLLWMSCPTFSYWLSLPKWCLLFLLSAPPQDTGNPKYSGSNHSLWVTKTFNWFPSKSVPSLGTQILWWLIVCGNLTGPRSAQIFG